MLLVCVVPAPRRHLELCRSLVRRISVPGHNAERLAYTDGICYPFQDVPGVGGACRLAIHLLGDERAAVEISMVAPEVSQAEAISGRRIDWSRMPPSLDPAAEDEDGSIIAGGTSGANMRAARKRWQVESVYTALLKLVNALAPLGESDTDGFQGERARLRVVDFGSGAGNATLAVAWLLRTRCSFVLVDMKPVASELVNQRVAKVEGLSKVVSSTIGRIEDFAEPFDIGVAVHACGLATDCAQLQCIARGVPYLLVPCCVGKLNNDVRINSPYSLPRPTTDSAWRRGSDSACSSNGSEKGFTIHQPRPPPLAFARTRRQNPGLPAGVEAPATGESGAMPRSGWLRSLIRNPAEWSALVSIANHNAYDFSVTTGDVAVRRLGKTILEADRNQVSRSPSVRYVCDFDSGKVFVPIRSSDLS